MKDLRPDTKKYFKIEILFIPYKCKKKNIIDKQLQSITRSIVKFKNVKSHFVYLSVPI